MTRLAWLKAVALKELNLLGRTGGPAWERYQAELSKVGHV